MFQTLASVTNPYLGSSVSNVHLVAIVGPGSKLEGTHLAVEGKVGHIHLARTLQLSGDRPEDVTIGFHHGVRWHQSVGVFSSTA